jgi:hypothetical protein
MLDRAGETALDLTGIVSLPVWAVVAIAAVLVLACALALVRGRGERASVSVAILVLILALAGWWARDHFARRDLAAAQRALDARGFELATRAFMPGSALGCLDAIAGETVEAACEKALFASPEATAAAVSYVAAQLSLLASARELGRHGEAASGMLVLRRALEADRFGVVAHVLALRDGCAPDQCRAFAWLGDTSRIKVNLAERPFDARIKTYAASWPAAGGRALASTPPSPAPSVAAKVPNNLYFPSATSIPPVNIMTAEPPPAQRPPQEQRPPQDTTGAADAATPTPPRRPPQTNSQARPPASAAPARATPVPSAPAQ